jgi:uncharacterized protein
MHIHVQRELRQPIGAVSEIDFSEDSLTVDGLPMQDITGRITLLRTDRGLLVSLQAEARLQFQCARCATNVESPVSISFDEEFVPVYDPNTGIPIRLPPSSDTFRIGPDFMLDLREAVRQYMLISEPAKPLCRVDCAGLCPGCGADLNPGPCACEAQADARWEALAGLTAGENEGS